MFQETLTQLKSQEEIVECGPTDILSQVLNVPEYPGRIKGKGFGVGKKGLFPPQKRYKQEDMDRLNKVVDTLVSKLSEFEKQLQEVRELQEKPPEKEVTKATEREQPASNLGIPSDKDSWTPNLPFDHLP